MAEGKFTIAETQVATATDRDYRFQRVGLDAAISVLLCADWDVAWTIDPSQIRTETDTARKVLHAHIPEPKLDRVTPRLDTLRASTAYRGVASSWLDQEQAAQVGAELLREAPVEAEKKAAEQLKSVTREVRDKVRHALAEDLRRQGLEGWVVTTDE